MCKFNPLKAIIVILFILACASPTLALFVGPWAVVLLPMAVVGHVVSQHASAWAVNDWCKVRESYNRLGALMVVFEEHQVVVQEEVANILPLSPPQERIVPCFPIVFGRDIIVSSY